MSPPFTLPALHAVLEIAGVGATICPLVLSESLRFSVYILPYVLVTIVEEITSIAVTKVLVPLSLIFVLVLPDMHTIP